MRLAFITVGDTSRLTGGYLYNARLISGLRERGIEVEEIVASGASPEEQEGAADRFGSTFEPAGFDVISVDALARVVCAPHLDRWREMRPVIAMVHELPSVAGGFDPDSATAARKLEEPLLRADLLVAVSNHGKSILEERGVNEASIRVVPPGFDRIEPRANSVASTREDRKLRALCVAQWIPRKGILGLVRAWRSRERPDAELKLIGETWVEPDYAARVWEAIGDDSSIIVSGPVEKAVLQEAYVASDLFVLPSRYEGYGMVYAEALGAGLPVIACDAGPVPELVGEDAALLVPPGDVDALSVALDRLMSDPDLRRKMSDFARRRAETLPRWEDTVAGFSEALQKAIASRSERSRA